MNQTITFRADGHQVDAQMSTMVMAVHNRLKDGQDVQVVIGKPKRTNLQNDRLQAMCRDIAEQVIWHGQKLSQDDWRHMLVAAWRKEGQNVVPGINTPFVILGQSSRNLRIDELAELITFAEAFGAEHEVKFSERAKG